VLFVRWAFFLACVQRSTAKKSAALTVHTSLPHQKFVECTWFADSTSPAFFLASSCQTFFAPLCQNVPLFRQFILRLSQLAKELQSELLFFHATWLVSVKASAQLFIDTIAISTMTLC